ncbi:MAG: hypothetical protein SGJ24_00130 [Chloroflexota bacterium]|nr:hypothetical protein [Chloroflexota bacterium]
MSNILTQRWLVFAVALILVGYVTPWIVTASAGTTLNAYDLAEWTSLHPDVRARTPSLFVTFCVRAMLLWSALMIAGMQVLRLYRIVGIVTLAVASLPPIEFLTRFDDGNYLQQTAITIALLVLSIGLIVWSGAPVLRRWLLPTTASIGLLGTLFSIVHGMVLMDRFDIGVAPGIGVLLTIIGCLIVIVATLRLPSRLRPYPDQGHVTV